MNRLIESDAIQNGWFLHQTLKPHETTNPGHTG